MAEIERALGRVEGKLDAVEGKLDRLLDKVDQHTEQLSKSQGSSTTVWRIGQLATALIAGFIGSLIGHPFRP